MHSSRAFLVSGHAQHMDFFLGSSAVTPGLSDIVINSRLSSKPKFNYPPIQPKEYNNEQCHPQSLVGLERCSASYFLQYLVGQQPLLESTSKLELPLSLNLPLLPGHYSMARKRYMGVFVIVGLVILRFFFPKNPSSQQRTISEYFTLSPILFPSCFSVFFFKKQNR